MGMKKITITLPDEVVEYIKGHVDPRGVSAYVTAAVEREVAMDKLGELSAALQEEHGVLTEEERLSTDEWLASIDAKHDAMRAGAEVRHNSGQVAA
ncbi:hypothetical protein ACFRJ1_33380 [Streptomyces sp. NPDC056773]|uniref:hypothetical protein n=2 Tax=unclassified Streptomyces TaxID=2593676 RepID=UPI00367CF416